MVRVDFIVTKRGYQSVRLRGHADYAEYGLDIVCAAVTSAFQLTANGLTEILHSKAQVTSAENEVSIRLVYDCSKTEYDFMAALYLQLNILSEDYAGTIQLNVTDSNTKLP